LRLRDRARCPAETGIAFVTDSSTGCIAMAIPDAAGISTKSVDNSVENVAAAELESSRAPGLQPLHKN
jgi:hypothetical protein